VESRCIASAVPRPLRAESPPTDQPNTTEVFGYISWKGLSARLNYTVTNAYATPDSRGSLYADLSATQPLRGGWSLGAHLGRREVRGMDTVTGEANSRLDYTDYKLSVAYAFRPDLNLTLAWTWTNANPSLYTLKEALLWTPPWSSLLFVTPGRIRLQPTIRP